nr:uncharacterized protein LOC124817168 [Hydra vulgaris]
MSTANLEDILNAEEVIPIVLLQGLSENVCSEEINVNIPYKVTKIDLKYQVHNKWGKSLIEMPLFTINNIQNHRKLSGKSKGLSIKKTLLRGKKFQEERYISSDSIFTYSANNVFKTKGLCRASMKKDIWEVTVHISQNSSQVIYACCSCPAGMSGYCNHVMALLLELADYSTKFLKKVPTEISCTSKQRQWGVPGGKKRYKAPIMSSIVKKENNKRGIKSTFWICPCCTTHSHLQICQYKIWSISNRLTSKYALASCGTTFYLEYLPLKELSDDYNDIVPDCIFSFEKKNYLKKIEVTYLEAKNIEKATVLQNFSDKWFALRRNKITSSNAHKVYIKTKNFDSLITIFTQKLNLIDSKLFQKAIKHGKDFEPIARETYIDVMKYKLNHSIKCRETGIVIQPKLPWLAASPDGKLINGELNNEFGLIEIKCPWSKRNRTPKELVLDESFYVKMKNDKPVLRKKNVNGYYTQIQMALGISQVTFCDFIVYTFKGCIIIRIPFDIMYFKDVVNKLNLFYIKYLLPAIVELETSQIEQ